MAMRLSDIFKLKNGLNSQKMHFLPVIELMSDSLTAIKVYVDRKK